jgi:N-acyl-D-aspartate/D-glutamate deacylase
MRKIPTRAGIVAIVVLVLGIAVPAGMPAEGQAPGRVDLILKNGRVIDGSGNPWFRGDIAVAGGRIVAIGRLGNRPADRVIDVDDLVVAPGFIDLMGQTASVLLSGEQAGLNLLSQGITTINAGEGETDAPLNEETAKRRGAAWRTMREFLAHLEKTGIPLNVAQTVGHTQVRSIVVGEEDRRATPEEMGRMKALVREAMEGGAIGLSTALIYPPAVYAPEEEIVELAKVVGEYGGRYFTHMRNEGDRLLEAIDEALRIGKQAGTPVHIFHLKTAGEANWPKMDQAIAALAAARAAGQEITADVYPYVNNGLGIRALIHPRHSAKGPEDLIKRLQDPAIRVEMRREMEEGTGWENWYANAGRDWDRIVISQINHPDYASYGGRSLGEIARAVGKDPWDVFFAICASGRNGAYAMPQSMSEANKIKAMRQPFVGFDTDVGPLRGPERASHPRGYGSFPRVLARYVRDLGALPLEEAVRKMSSLAANVIMAHDRGRIAEGLAADLVIFDPARVRDRATFAEPALLSEGIAYVIVNGVPVLENGKLTGAKPGRVLRGPGAAR